MYLSFVIRKASDNVAMQMDRGVTNSQVRSELGEESIFSCEASPNVLHARDL